MQYSPLRLINLEVTREDIEAMYDRYDSGMADRTTANAICLALKRKLQRKYCPQIQFARHHKCRLKVGKEDFYLTPEVYWWLDRANNGFAVHPARFTIVLPEALLRSEATGSPLQEATAAS